MSLLLPVISEARFTQLTTVACGSKTQEIFARPTPRAAVATRRVFFKGGSVAHRIFELLFFTRLRHLICPFVRRLFVD